MQAAPEASSDQLTMTTSPEEGNTQPKGYDAEKWGFELDSENKAKKLVMWRLQSPHVRAFHLSWTSFFTTFMASFAMAALVPIVRQNLDLTTADLGASGIASVCGTIGARVMIGTVCDTIGPRYGVAGMLLLFAPAVFCASLIIDRAGIITVRFLIGISMSVFVCNQFWAGTMFSPTIVGMVNATCGGWGNLGGGVALLVMPLIYSGIKQSSVPGFTAWRWAFFVPGGMYLLLAICTLLLAQDTPDGSYRDLRKRRTMQIDGKTTFLVALQNYRTWILALNYGYCFGVELTVNNVIVAYFFDQFGLSFKIAGIVGAVFGLMNIGSRSIGGVSSDVLGKYFGMRGRLWAYFIMQVLVGALSIILGNVDDSLGATIGVMIIFSAFVQAAEGACYAVVPFVSRRSYGAVAGLVGAGGSAGSAVTQALFFADNEGLEMSVQEGFVWMGVMVLGVSVATLPLLYWPAWGSMLLPAKETATEEDYYLAEWTAEEVAANLHIPSLKFALESKSMRGKKLLSSHKAMNRLKSDGGSSVPKTVKKNKLYDHQ